MHEHELWLTALLNDSGRPGQFDSEPGAQPTEPRTVAELDGDGGVGGGLLMILLLLALYAGFSVDKPGKCSTCSSWSTSS